MEVTTIPDIRERNDRPKDKQPKHQAVSIVQRQLDSFMDDFAGGRFYLFGRRAFRAVRAVGLIRAVI